MKEIKPSQCPKHSKCSAPLCPIDSDWEKRNMIKEDRVCFYLNEASKSGSEDRFRGRKDEVIFQIAFARMPFMKKHSKILGRRLERASLTGSQISVAKFSRD